jgi:hypothetical protein
MVQNAPGGNRQTRAAARSCIHVGSATEVNLGRSPHVVSGMTSSARILVCVAIAGCGGRGSGGGGGGSTGPRSVTAPVACELPPDHPPGPPVGDRACTEMGCVSGYSVWLDAPTGWPPGVYRFELVADGKVETCTGELGAETHACGEPTMQCTGARVAAVDELDCGTGLGTIGFYAMPCDVRVVVSRGSLVIADRELTPAYRWVSPNGEGCSPSCMQATDRIEIR